MPSIQWTKPSPLWDDLADDPRTPWIAEFHADSFLADFLALMAGKTPGQTATDMVQWRLSPPASGSTRTLYQPFHSRYYLVTGSLVCRQAGLPDRTVRRKDGEKTSFVLRRQTANGEEAWIQHAGWAAVGSVHALAEGEEQLPLHPVPLCPGPADPAVRQLRTPPGRAASGPIPRPCDARTLYYGYIPVAGREQYHAPLADPAKALADLLDVGGGALAKEDPRFDEIESRVLHTWRSLFVNPDDPASTGYPSTAPEAQNNVPESQQQTLTLYILLDLGDWLQRELPTVFAALGPSGTSLPDDSQRAAFFNELKGVKISITRADGTVQIDVPLTDVLFELIPALSLVQGGEGTPPTALYDLYNATHVTNATTHTTARVDASSAVYLRNTGSSTLYTTLKQALAEEKVARKAAGQPWLTVPPDVADMVKADPAGPSDLPPEMYVVRLVYEYCPCPPVVSDASVPFTFARLFAPDAPARHVRLQMPNPRDIPKFARGVGMETSPELRDVMDRVNKGMLTGGGLSGSASGWELGMICSFSLPIIMLVAFIVMFIFLIALNFIFWWLPFLRICFPIPVRKR